jgi:hypothetical protein
MPKSMKKIGDFSVSRQNVLLCSRKKTIPMDLFGADSGANYFFHLSKEVVLPS